MLLLTKQNKKDLPKLYSQDGLGDDAIAYVKFFTPWSSWTFYATEYDGDDTFFGLIDSQYVELGYVSLAEIKSVAGPYGLKIERDRHFSPTTLGEIRKKELRGINI